MASDTQLLIRGVTVVDPRDGSVRPGQDVRIDGETIVSVAAAGDGDAPTAARVVDAAGQYLIPGFNDMHAHPLGSGDPSGSLDLMLAYGVTGFRQMSGSDRLLRDRAAGTLMPAGAPRLLAMPGTVLTPFNAEFLGATDVMGSVAAGKHADLVLLGADPVADLDALKEKVAATRSAR